jgi:uncharacterized lipoprotein YbaY/heat shock protein HslJ
MSWPEYERYTKGFPMKIYSPFSCLIVVLFAGCTKPESAVTTPAVAPMSAETLATNTPANADVITITGTATYMQRMAMPPEAVLTVRIEDVSFADKSSPVLVESQVVFADRQVPIPFEIHMPRGGIDAHGRYALRADISVAGQKRFVTDHEIAVLAEGAPTKFDLLLVGVKASTATEPATTSTHYRGNFVYMADAANFTDCVSGKRWPVANAGDYLATERGYVAARKAPGESLMMSFTGHVEMRAPMEGPPREHMVIDKLAAFEPAARCEVTASVALRDTPWRLVELDGQPITTPPGQPRDMGLMLATEKSHVSGYGGCNNIVGSYQSEGSALRFTGMVSTMMACDPAAMERERKFNQALGAVTAYRIEGQQLLLLAGEKQVARLLAATSR